MENQELWSKDKMGDAKWVQYLCRLGFSVDFVHRLGAGIDSMGKLLFHVLIGLSYFPNAKERIRDCISTSDCICSDQEISPDWVSHLNTHPSDEPSWDHSRGTASGKAGQFSCHTEHAQARRCSSLTGTTFCTQTEISLKYNPDISVWPERCERQLAALTAIFSNDWELSLRSPMEGLTKGWAVKQTFWASYENFLWGIRVTTTQLSPELFERLLFLFWKNYFIFKDNRFFQD